MACALVEEFLALIRPQRGEMSERTNRMAWKRLDLPDPFAPTVKVRKEGEGPEVSAAMVDGRGGGADAWI